MSSSHSARSRTKARDEIIAMLKEDHKRAKVAFREFEKLDHKGEVEACRQLAERTCAELEVHAELEEQLFYPAVREAIHDDDLMNEAQIEHMTFKMLIGHLRSMDVGERAYAATFTVLAEYVKHHVKDEESNMFKQLTRKRVDWPALLADMIARRMELMAEKRLTSAGAEEEKESADEEKSISPYSDMQERESVRGNVDYQLERGSKSSREAPEPRPRASSDDPAG